MGKKRGGKGKGGAGQGEGDPSTSQTGQSQQQRPQEQGGRPQQQRGHPQQGSHQQQQPQRPQQQGGHQQQRPQQQGGHQQRRQQQGGYQQQHPQQGGHQQRRPQQQGGHEQWQPQQQGGHQQQRPQQQQPQQQGGYQQHGYQQQRSQQQGGQQYQQRPQQQSPQQWGPPQIRPQSPMQGPPGFMHPQQQSSGQQPQRMPQQQQPRRQPQQQQSQRPPQQQARQQYQTPSPSSSGTLSPVSAGGDTGRLQVAKQPGTKGRVIKIESNHFALNLGSLMSAVHYDVTITPDTPKNLLREVMRAFGRQHYPKNNPAFDGRKNLYSPTKLPFGDAIDGKVTVEGENKPRDFQVDIKFARSVDLSPLHNVLQSTQSLQDALQCLDIVLRSAPSLNCIIAGRSFFTPPREIITLGDGMQLYYGFYQSAIRGWKPLLNVDVAHKAFPKASAVLDILCELGSDYRNTMKVENLQRGIDERLRATAEKFLKLLKVRYELPNQPSSKKVYRINGFGPSANEHKFKQDDGKVLTIVQYYRDLKRYQLRFPNLPTLWVGAPNREQKILLPIELCTLMPGQVTNRKMTENQTSAMIKKAATDTQTRKAKIMNAISNVRHNMDPCVKEFGFSVSGNFEQLGARVLPPPTLGYAQKASVRPQKGVWRADRNQFINGAEINKWMIATATRYPPREGTDNMAQMLMKMGQQSGMRFNSPPTPSQAVGGRQAFNDFVQFFNERKGYDLIFVIVPSSGPTYSYVKKAAEINVGCLTQCIKDRTLQRMNAQTVGNILLKVNSKMNGTNHIFVSQSLPSIMRRPTMLMGADVTHPGPDSKDIPSVAAVTASNDPHGFRYNICWRLQPPKVEIIEDLCAITKEQLLFFYNSTKSKPEHIVFFRDGVSEGQFEQVKNEEIRAIRAGCKQLQGDYEPKITFLVVQKRHHTRLFPLDPRDSEDKNGNVPAGTCVDTHIVNPTMQDFYLVSHASIQGVAKPTKYCTLWDDNDMSNDQIEELTYHLCHMFTRCNRSVSYPAPTYYAHLAAARAKVYIENDRLDMHKLKEIQNKYQIKEVICKGKPMFFV